MIHDPTGLRAHYIPGAGWLPQLISEIATDVFPFRSVPAGAELTFCGVTSTQWLVPRTERGSQLTRCPGCGEWVDCNHAASACSPSQEILRRRQDPRPVHGCCLQRHAKSRTGFANNLHAMLLLDSDSGIKVDVRQGTLAQGCSIVHHVRRDLGGFLTSQLLRKLTVTRSETEFTSLKTTASPSEC